MGSEKGDDEKPVHKVTITRPFYMGVYEVTQAQWKAYFATGKHKKGAEKLDSVLKPEQVKDVQTFLVNHASDSPQPETCGG